MANLIKRGATFYVRLHIPQDRQRDVGVAMGAAGGIKREVVKTLQTSDHREAQRRRDAGLAAARAMVDAALRKHRMAPLTDWAANWMDRAVERRTQMQAGGSKVNGWLPPSTPDGAPEPVFEVELTGETVEREVEHLERSKGPEVARQFAEIALGGSMSIAEAARQWIEAIRGGVRAGTIVGYEASIERLGTYLMNHEALPSLEGAGLETVTRRIAGEVIAARRAERASETVQRDFSAYNGLWRWAVRRGYAELNPWTDQTAGLKAPRSGEAMTVKRAYEPGELVKLLRAGPDLLAPNGGGYAPALWDLLRLVLLTGARASEIMGLTVGDVIEDGTAIATSERGKSDSAPRIIPLHLLAQGVLQSRIASLPGLQHDSSLWPEVPGVGADERKAKIIVTRFVPVRRRILGEDDGADLHSLRRCFMTACETAQHAGGRINRDLIALLVGHKRGAMSLDLYSEWSRLGRRRMAGGLGDKLVTLRAGVEDAVELGMAPEVLKVLRETSGDRPAMRRSTPAFTRKTPAPTTRGITR